MKVIIVPENKSADVLVCDAHASQNEQLEHVFDDQLVEIGEGISFLPGTALILEYIEDWKTVYNHVLDGRTGKVIDLIG